MTKVFNIFEVRLQPFVWSRRLLIDLSRLSIHQVRQRPVRFFYVFFAVLMLLLSAWYALPRRSFDLKVRDVYDSCAAVEHKLDVIDQRMEKLEKAKAKE